jgi:hypothetical protein
MAISMSYPPNLPSYLPRLSLVLCQPSVKARQARRHTRIGRDPTALAREHRLKCGANGGYLATSSRRDSKPPTMQGNWLSSDIWDLAGQAWSARNARAL